MPKQDTTVNAAEVWEVIQRYTNLSSVADIKDHAEQIAEIDRRLSSLTKDLATIGAAVTPTGAAVALGINKDTYNRYIQALAQEKDEKGNSVNISLDKSGKDETEKRYILARSEAIKKYLDNGEFLALTLAQAKDNRENGGALFILQNVYGVGQDKAKDQITVSLEDLLAAAAKIKERAGQS